MSVNFLPVQLTFRLVSRIALPFLVRFCFQIWYVDVFCQEQEQVLSVMQPKVIYAQARNLTSVFV